MTHTLKAPGLFACCSACNFHGTYFMSKRTEIFLNPALFPLTTVSGSVVPWLLSSLFKALTPCSFYSFTALTGTSPTEQNPRSKKRALPNILAAILGPRPESTGTVPSFLEVLAAGGKPWHLSSVPPLLLHLTILHARTQSGQ